MPRIEETNQRNAPREAALRVRSFTREKSARNKLTRLRLAQTELLVFLIFPSLPHRLQGDPSSVLKFTVWMKFQLASINMHITMRDMDQIMLLKSE